MKKAVSVLCILVCTLSLCMSVSAEDNQAYALYQKAAAEYESLRSIELVGNIHLLEWNGSYWGEDDSMKYRMVRVNAGSGLQMEYSLYRENELTDVVYFRDGVYYRDDREYGNKTIMDAKEEGLDSSLLFHRDFISLPEAAFKDAQVESTASGGCKVSLKVTDRTYDPFDVAAALFDEDAVPTSTLVDFTYDADGVLSDYQVRTYYYSGGDYIGVQMTVRVATRNDPRGIAYPRDLLSYGR